MSEQPRNQEVIQSPEKTADQLYEELNQSFNKTTELMEQVHALELKTFQAGLSKEELSSIIDERNKLAALRDEAWEAEKRLEEQWKKKEDAEMAKLEEELKKFEKFEE